MRKRRSLANKLTIMVCAVLCAVSAFFYAPMEVSAEENSFENTSSSQFWNNHSIAQLWSSNSGDLVSGLDSNSYYEVDFTLTGSVVFSESVYMRCSCIEYGDLVLYYGPLGLDSDSKLTTHSLNYSGSLVAKGSDLIGKTLRITSDLLIGTISSKPYTISNSWDFNFVADSVKKLSSTDSEDYQNGYNAGYAEGESAGYGNGYSNGFADGEASVDTDAIYDEAFQAGKDSVDTQSYYDAGYQAGYDAAYSAGYESGYDVGYQSAMDRIENWGADTSDYPLQISSGSDNGYFSVHVGSDIPFNYRDSVSWRNSNAYNPNHTYKYVINFSNLDVGLNSDILYDFWSLYLNIGGIEYNIFPFPDSSVTVFIPGDRMTTSYSFDWVLYNCANFVSGDSNLAYVYVDYDFVIYDMGPSGDTQNHIANQTDQLTNGFDESQGNSVNNDLSSGINEYQTAEDSLWATATTGLKDFTFFDFESVPAIITGMSFITSIMGSWFSHAGGASGVGIVLSILFSVMLVAMVLGLYRLYQSKGGKK